MNERVWANDVSGCKLRTAKTHDLHSRFLVEYRSSHEQLSKLRTQMAALKGDPPTLKLLYQHC